MSLDKKLKICHVITRMVVGGAQENTLFTCLDHVAKGHDVTLLTGFSSGREGELLLKSKLPDNLKIVETPYLVRELNPIKDFQAYCFMKKFFRKQKFDVVHTHSSKAGILGRLAAWDSKSAAVVVHTVHGQAFHPYEKPWKNAVYKWAEHLAAGHCHKIFAVAQAMIDQCVAAKIAPEDKYMVVYSGMEIEQFLNAEREPDLRRSLNIPETAQVIGTVARLFPLKGYEFFFPAAEVLAKKHENLHFLLVGDGSMHDELKNRAAAAGLSERFHFAGLVAPNQVYRYIAQMDILSHLSLREGLPRSAVQALAGGVPVIGFALDGTPEVVINGVSGFCVEPENIEEVIEKSSLLLKDEKLRSSLGNNGRDIVREKFSHQYMSDVLEKEYLKLYKSCCEQQGKN